MKRLTENRKTIMLAIFTTVFVSIVIGVTLGGEYDATMELIKKTEKNFGITNIQYDRILYSHPFEGGPLGEGDGVLVLQLSDKSAEEINRQLRAKIESFPMNSYVKYFTYELRKETSFSRYIKKIKKGYYGYYSYTENKIIYGNDLIKAARYATPVLSGYLYIQYDKKNKLIYIWDHSG